jgi:transcriptional regulator with PAS, ATPase and Fis domain
MLSEVGPTCTRFQESQPLFSVYGRLRAYAVIYKNNCSVASGRICFMARARSAVTALAKILDRAAAPIYILDDERQIVYCNAPCAAWVGTPLEDLIGLKCSYHSSPEPRANDVVAANLCPPPGVFAGERMCAEVCGSTGERSTRRAQFLPFADDSGEFPFVLAIVELQANVANPDPGDDFSDDTLHEAVRQFRQAQAARYRVDRLIGRSAAIARAREQVAVAVDSSASVLIVGPVGSGKDHVAQTIHYRGGEPFGALMPLACSTLGADLLMSTLAAAVQSHPKLQNSTQPSGTLLLGDIDELPPDAHAEFARWLVQERSNLRIIARSNHPLEDLLAAGSFRSDLAYALSTITIHLPALRERQEDLPLLAQIFLEDLNAAGGKQVGSFASETLDLLAAYRWPGNLDELAAVIAEAHKQATGPVVMPADLPKRIGLATETLPRSKRTDEAIVLEDFLARVERELIERALARAKGNKTRAAKLLGMTRPKLYRRLVQLKLV